VTPSRGMLSASAGIKIETDRNFAFFANPNSASMSSARRRASRSH